MPRASALAAPAVLLAGPTVLAFASGGYFAGPRLVALGVAALALVLAAVTIDGDRLRCLARDRRVLLAAGGLALLTGWTALSTAWAPLAGPATDSWERALLYLVALLAAVLALAHRAIAAWAEPALAAGVTVVMGYAVLGHAGVIAVTETQSAGGRLDQPLTYWNAQGALAAIGLVLCVRLAGARDRPPVLRAAAAAAAPLLGVAVYLTFSRGALTALAVGVAVLVALTPTWSQIRAGAIALGGAAVAVAAFEALPDGAALAVTALALAAGAAVQAWSLRGEEQGAAPTGPAPAASLLRVAAWVAAAALLVAPFGAAAIGSQPDEPAFGATAERLGSTGSNRYAYWDAALATFASDPAVGVGAGGFQVAWLQRREIDERVRDAHSLPLETAAELGLIGVVLLALLVAGVAAGARRAVRGDPALAAGPAAALAVWGAHASIDWDWEMPALTLVAVVLAGLLLARGCDA